jgi:hypothetical protein
MRLMKSPKVVMCGALALSAILALDGSASARRGTQPATEPLAPTMRPVPSPLYGVTVDDVTNLRDIKASSGALPHMPITRVYFDVRRPVTYYATAVRDLQPVSYLMGELLDSSDSRRIGTGAYNRRVKSYLAAFGNSVDVWEIGNEVNGNWTGRYPKVATKVTSAYNAVTAAGRRTALTLYYNVGCGDGARELDPLAFSQSYVPTPVRNGLGYVLLSYYEGNCNGIRPTTATWAAYFAQLHSLYPNGLLGFGEIGMANPATSSTMATAQSIMSYYYGLGVNLPYYVGGYFWWYYDEDCLPIATKPLWGTLQRAFAAEAAALAH